MISSRLASISSWKTLEFLFYSFCVTNQILVQTHHISSLRSIEFPWSRKCHAQKLRLRSAKTCIRQKVSSSIADKKWPSSKKKMYKDTNNQYPRQTWGNFFFLIYNVYVILLHLYDKKTAIRGIEESRLRDLNHKEILKDLIREPNGLYKISKTDWN